MKSKNFLIPDGIEYYIGDSATKFDRIKSKIIKIYDKYDYIHIIPPIFDSLDNLLNLNSTDLDNKTAYILDRSNGNEIGVRADITPQISKVDYQITNGQGNSKFSYMGDILCLSPGPFDRINPFQTGVEHFGNVSKKIDIEIIKQIQKSTSTPLVLHGGSGIPNRIRKKLAKETNIAKFNIGTELRVTFCNALRKQVKNNPRIYDRLQLLKPTIPEITKITKKIIKNFGPK